MKVANCHSYINSKDVVNVILTCEILERHCVLELSIHLCVLACIRVYRMLARMHLQPT